jgi:hypothetical protein
MLAVLLIAFLTPFAVHAAPSPAEWTLSRILDRALQNSPQLKAAQSEITFAEGNAQQAGRWDNPEVSLNGGPMTSSILKGYTYSASIKQSIPLFGQKSRASAVEKGSQALAETQLELTRLGLQHQIVRLSYDLLSAEIHLKHVTHRRKNLAVIGQYLNSRPFASPAQMVEKTLIQNRIREIEEKFFDSENQLKRAWHDFNIYLDLQETISRHSLGWKPWFCRI